MGIFDCFKCKECENEEYGGIAEFIKERQTLEEDKKQKTQTLKKLDFVYQQEAARLLYDVMNEDELKEFNLFVREYLDAYQNYVIHVNPNDFKSRESALKELKTSCPFIMSLIKYRQGQENPTE